MLTYIRSALSLGFMVVFPILIFLFILGLLIGLVNFFLSPLIAPLTLTGMSGPVAFMAALFVVVVACFLLGAFLKTKRGSDSAKRLDNILYGLTPAYGTIKGIFLQIFARSEMTFTKVALVAPFADPQALLTAFVTDEHDDGSFTVFMPTGPNPTCGWVFHLPADRVHAVDVSVDIAMRSVIAVGAGSKPLIKDLNARPPKP